MLIISHRGNINGPEKDFENNPERIQQCIEMGLDVEIDLWWKDGWFLGHDLPQYEIDLNFLQKYSDSLWIHCKNSESLNGMWNNCKHNFNYFWHQEDDFTLTSYNYIWTFPKKSYWDFYANQIILDFSRNVDFDFYRNTGILGICVDYVER